MELTDFEFLKRFCAHILPSGFQRIRYYGILAPVNRKGKLAIVRELLDCVVISFSLLLIKQFVFQKIGIDPTVCNVCGSPNRDIQIIPADPDFHRRIVNFPALANPPPNASIPMPRREGITALDF